MSRSYRKTKIFGHSMAESEKQDKKILHGIIRARIRNNLSGILRLEDVEEVDPNAGTNPQECLNVAKMDKDGKGYWTGATTKSMRK